ncbi:hypothetical protein [Thalassomonas actiniarum]|uniref:Uncharacterized protein n=1 Tax=Thalassomonas actiniarum TaxID=485447 RepID=A0AAE9YWB1_9GAMM|nr:hypothetical protein [Thalassomonas actiniarum]WDE00752.1 hypothetical protein SG35_009025 [Thalassomonas actiniarum]
MKKFDLIILIALALCCLSFFYTYTQYYELGLCLYLFVVAMVYFDNINVRHICALLLIYKLSIYSLMNFYLIDAVEPLENVWGNVILFSIQLTALAALTLIMFFRPILSRMLHKRFSPEDDTKIAAGFGEIFIVSGYALLTLVMLLTFVENIIRNLEYIGFSNEIAQPFWNWTFFYDNLEPIFHSGEILIGVVILFLALVNPDEVQENLATE